MIKLKTSKNDLKNKAHYIISIGYCDACYLLYFKDAFSYCAGVYGWSCDNYYIDGVNGIISTGYQPINNKNVKFNYQLIRDYNEKARDIMDSREFNYEYKKTAVNQLLKQFMEEVTK